MLWDYRPTRDQLKLLGLEYSGYPIPEETLSGVRSETIEIRPGDWVVLNGAYVHGVQPSSGSKVRLLVNYFFSPISDNTVVTWT